MREPRKCWGNLVFVKGNLGNAEGALEMLGERCVLFYCWVGNYILELVLGRETLKGGVLKLLIFMGTGMMIVLAGEAIS